jgi:putative ABC transport system permease protein
MLKPARLSPADLGRLGATGLRTRPLRVVLSALGVAIGIAAMLAVVGISSSSRAELDRTLNRLGTNLLTARPGKDLTTGTPAKLPPEATAMVGRIGPVVSAGSTGHIEAAVYRNDHVARGETGGIEVLAADLTLLETVHATLRTGVWLNRATAEYPGVVLGAVAQQRLDLPGRTGTDEVGGRVWLGGVWYSVVGVLDPVPFAPELDSAALVGWESAKTYLKFDGHPTTVYLRTTDRQVDAVRSVLGRTVNPEKPSQVAISRPSDALAAKLATHAAWNGLLLGLAAVALLVGGVGIANTMVISTLERRPEIGLRRALGATRGQIRAQFLSEALLLSALGGAGGALLGSTICALYATSQHWPTVVPVWATLGALGTTLLIGVAAGLYPAIKASKLAPTEALATP